MAVMIGHFGLCVTQTDCNSHCEDSPGSREGSCGHVKSKCHLRRGSSRVVKTLADHVTDLGLNPHGPMGTA